MPANLSVTESTMPALLEEVGSPWGEQVTVELVDGPRGRGRRGAGRRVRVRWGDASFEFVAVLKSRSTPKAIENALLEARDAAASSGVPAMLVVPHLDERRLDRLAEESVSGIDLCGNGIVVVPGRLLLRRSGRPNRYPDSQPTRYAYRGATSIVPRVFLCRPVFGSVGAIREAIAERGGSVAPSTVSKALARMVEDVLVERDASRITLVQPDALLDRLRGDFRMPQAQRVVRVQVASGLPGLFARVNEAGERPRLLLSGVSSQDRYAAGLRFDEPVAYCERLSEVRERAGDRWQASERFADLTVMETGDRAAFFDARTDERGVACASPVQAYLELAAGDRRDREMAGEIRAAVLREVEEAMASSRSDR